MRHRKHETHATMILLSLLLLTPECQSFMTTPNTKQPLTKLNLSPPPFIIGPMIRRMREEQRKKNAPLASDDEKLSEAPGLKIGTGVWKWPPVWPFDENMFTRKGEEKGGADGGNAAMNMLMKAQAGNLDAEVEVQKLDLVKYWGEEKGEVRTELDEEAAEQLRSHYSYYLKDGMSILELGAAEDSYLPENLKLARHVGIGLSPKLMKENPSLTETLVVDLNVVKEEMGIDSDEIRENLEEASFDAILVANTVEYLTSPREVFRTAWQLLKPNGILIAAFANKDTFSDKFSEAQTNMWQKFNDDQHMWICGSFFQFSASDGWVSLKGFDISPEGAKKQTDQNPLQQMLDKGKSNNIYTVQATKGVVDEAIDAEDPEKSFKSKMWMTPTLEERDKILLAPRLASIYTIIEEDDVRERIVQNVETLPGVYEVLIKMDQFAFPFNLQAQLAADLVKDPDFNGGKEQIVALKMGLGLRKPSPDFWQPVGEETSAMQPEDKVNLLAYLVPRFGSSDPKQQDCLDAFVSGLKPTFSLIRTKCPAMAESDVQMLGSELLAAEILIPGRSTREEFAKWLNALEEGELNGYLERRKSFKKKAVEDMKTMQEERVRLEKEREERKKEMEEQVEKARKERTMVFNEKTGKMEAVEK